MQSPPTSLVPGTVNAATGQAAYAYINASIDAALSGQVDAVTTGPIHKEAIRAAGVPYPGHTEIYAAKTGADRACMMLTSDELTCSFVTTHVGYRDVPGLLSQQRIYEVIRLSHDAMSRLRERTPKLVVCGLNPHAGENGLFGGQEEERLIIPAIEQAREEGIEIEGPLPPDTAFLPKRRKETDCFVCMYHDQGHIPLKALAFDLAVNITLGLPIIRTSVDHGTALDIAWQGKAEVTSMIEAIDLATRTCHQSEFGREPGAPIPLMSSGTVEFFGRVEPCGFEQASSVRSRHLRGPVASRRLFDPFEPSNVRPRSLLDLHFDRLGRWDCVLGKVDVQHPFLVLGGNLLGFHVFGK